MRICSRGLDFTLRLLAADKHKMNADSERLTEQVIGAAFEVSNQLGAGFLERVYERALLCELRLRGIKAQGQVCLPVAYKGELVGDYCVDLLVEDVLLVELKCVRELASEHMAQCLNYLKASGHELCLLFNFQKPRVECKRVVVSKTFSRG